MLSIIIVNFRSSPLIIDCLHSLRRFDPQLHAEIIVVDNASGDNSHELILGEFPQVKWIDMGYNAGFARANNAGIRAATGDTVLLLNPDTLAINDSVSRCLKLLNESDFSSAGVQLLDEKRQPQISGNYFMKGGLNHLLPLPYWGTFIRWIGYRTKTKIPNVQEAGAVHEVDWISGAFLMVKRKSIEQAGLMDEDFFLYAEEVEWCSRLKKSGPLCIFGNLHIIHLEGGSINREQNAPEKGYHNLFDKKGLQLMVSNHLRVRKQYGVFWFLFLLVNYSWAVPVYFVLSFFHQLLKGRNPFGEWKKAARFAGNVGVLWSLAPRIIGNRPSLYKMF